MTTSTTIYWENLTAMEKAIFRCFPRSGHLYDLYNPDMYDDSCGTWVDVKDWEKASGLTMNQIKGVLASLTKKRLIVISFYDEGENWLTFTKEGYALLKNVA